MQKRHNTGGYALSRLRGAARDEAFVKISEKLARVLGVAEK